jgi:mono/diheme cytochrome c family protein
LLKILIYISLLCSISLAQEKIDNTFITKFEYGQMLYKNPRGIGCHKCHGKDAKGSFIALYKDKKGNIRKITAPDISHTSKKDFDKKLNIKKNRSKIMPTYFLTQDELDSIYFYIKNLDTNL